MKIVTSGLLTIAMSIASYKSFSQTQDSKVRLINLDPGHFHASLVQKKMYENVDPAVYVYAPEGPEVQQYLKQIEAYNKSTENTTYWKEEVYLGKDFLDKMLQEKKGNVVVISGNNRDKTEYIKRSIDGGFNVLADKPMVIDQAGFNVLKSTFAAAPRKKVLLYDIMTERFEITNMLQRELAMTPAIFGSLQKGTPENPAVEMESVHFFYKYVSGNILTRPSWFMDVSQQGEGMVDVATHLVDLVQWECFPGKTIDYKKDIKLTSARKWSTDLTLTQFSGITKQNAFPDFLKDKVQDSVLKVFANGEMNYQVNGVNVKVIAKWDYKAPEGSGDTHYSIMRGTKANIIIRQGAEQSFKPAVYIEPVNNNAFFEKQLSASFKTIQAKHPGVELKKTAKGWEVIIPEKYKEGHEAHFARVTENFLSYLKKGDMPAWEVPNMLSKYYTTTQALDLAGKK
ncbi:MAG: oxidoreductase [Segetibacter sp.]|nr:oxidoreductase [Segetibacter sp.]